MIMSLFQEAVKVRFRWKKKQGKAVACVARNLILYGDATKELKAGSMYYSNVWNWL